MLVLTNCTFDGHVDNVERVMQECLAIKPDLIFLWDEAWFGFARFSPFLRRRTAMGAAAKLRAMFRSRPTARVRGKEGRQDRPENKNCSTTLLPDPDKVRIRVYETDSMHKSMSALRQGSMIVVADQDFHTVEAPFQEAFFTHTSTSPNLQIIASLDLARRQMELEGYELVQRAIQLAIETCAGEVNSHPLISKYFKRRRPGRDDPGGVPQVGLQGLRPARTSTWAKLIEALDNDEFALDPTRITLLCGTRRLRRHAVQGAARERYDIQINKTSRNSVLVQTNINNTRSDLAHLIKALADLSREIDKRPRRRAANEKAAFEARVKSLMEDVPDLPNFSRFHDAFRDNPKSKTAEGHMRAAFFMAYDARGCEYVKLNSKEIDERLKNGPELVSANFVIPYPPGFPIMVPGQVITQETITFMRKLDVKEIHGYNAARPEAAQADALAARRRKSAPRRNNRKRRGEMGPMQGFFQFAANPYILLFFVVGGAVLVGKFTIKGYGLGMVAAADRGRRRLSSVGVDLRRQAGARQLRQVALLLPVHVRGRPARRPRRSSTA